VVAENEFEIDLGKQVLMEKVSVSQKLRGWGGYLIALLFALLVVLRCIFVVVNIRRRKEGKKAHKRKEARKKEVKKEIKTHKKIRKAQKRNIWKGITWGILLSIKALRTGLGAIFSTAGKYARKGMLRLAGGIRLAVIAPGKTIKAAITHLASKSWLITKAIVKSLVTLPLALKKGAGFILIGLVGFLGVISLWSVKKVERIKRYLRERRQKKGKKRLRKELTEIGKRKEKVNVREERKIYKEIRKIPKKKSLKEKKKTVGIVFSAKSIIQALVMGLGIIFLTAAKYVRKGMFGLAGGIRLAVVVPGKALKTAIAWLVFKPRSVIKALYKRPVSLFKALRRGLRLILTCLIKLLGIIGIICLWPVKKIKTSLKERKQKKLVEAERRGKEELVEQKKERVKLGKEKAVELGQFVVRSMVQGFSKREVKKMLVRKGWSKEIVGEYVEKIGKKVDKEREIRTKKEKKLERESSSEEELILVKGGLEEIKSEVVGIKEEEPEEKKPLKTKKKEFKVKESKEERWKKKLKRDMEYVERELGALE
jgi:uncharacterized membrane protein YhiD involved in acid resistance